MNLAVPSGAPAEHVHATMPARASGRAAWALVSALALASLAGCLSSVGPEAPTIRQDPPNRTAFATQSVIFDVGASGAPTLQFQWLRDGVAIAGATGTTYTTPPLSASDDGARFSVRISNDKGSVTSKEGLLTVRAAPVISVAPQAQTVDVGATASFSVTASGESLTYQWRRNDVPITGATSATYTTAATVASDDGAQISVDVLNPAGFTASAPVTLTVRSVPTLLTSPLEQTVAVGDPVQFHVVAVGGELAYQWRRNGAEIAGATRAQYSIAAASAADDGASYSVVVTNPRGSIESTPVTLRVVAAAATPPPRAPADVAAARTSTTAESFTLVRRSNGTVVSWGYNNDGQRGDGTTGATNDAPGTVTLPSGQTARQIAAGGNHALALLANGTVLAWGRNTSGQLGQGDATARPTPTAVTLPRAAIAIAAGREFSIALLDDGRVCAWGLNTSGELGNATRLTNGLPVDVTGIDRVVAIAAGNSHVLALRDDGSVWGWGANASGQLGTGDFVLRRVPTPTLASGVFAIRAGGDASFALGRGRTLYAWGETGDGQLGIGGATSTDRPAPLAVLAAAVDVGAADRMVIVAGSDGQLRTSGANEAGSLGDGTTTPRTTFGVLPTPANLVAVAAGGRTYALALAADGTVYAWGDNAGKQLGNSSIAAGGVTTPTAVPNFDAIP